MSQCVCEYITNAYINVGNPMINLPCWDGWNLTHPWEFWGRLILRFTTLGNLVYNTSRLNVGSMGDISWQIWTTLFVMDDSRSNRTAWNSVTYVDPVSRHDGSGSVNGRLMVTKLGFLLMVNGKPWSWHTGRMPMGDKSWDFGVLFHRSMLGMHKFHVGPSVFVDSHVRLLF